MHWQNSTSEWAPAVASLHTVIGNIVGVGLNSYNIMLARNRRANICNAMQIIRRNRNMSHLSLFFFLHWVVEFQLVTVWLGDRWHRRDVILIFPRNAMTWLGRGGERLGSIPASLVLQSWGDGSLQPSENHALWNSKPSLYYFKCSKKKWARGTCRLVTAVMIGVYMRGTVWR